MAMEKKFFEDNPHKGEFVHWLTVGSLLNPAKFPKDVRDRMGKELPDWQLDHLHERIPHLNSVLHQGAAKNVSTVLYVHCEAGEDRTGETSGSYYMQYLGWSFAKALAYDNHIESRDIHVESKYGMQWYCLYLEQKLGMSSLNCMDVE
eukprot:TRINITY_DN3458_c0_g2_i1.p2 TRINITY_DN3458_c0_g2~~TRINITY_DN3458_c0_g2_i1.p2  ORF type:complete len:148 (+),score=37.74 TRINITY_DN3458_c0_g2_i1:140-583(+)